MHGLINITTSYNLSAVTHPLASSALLPRRLKYPEQRRFLLTLHCTCLHPAVLLAQRAKVTAKVAEANREMEGNESVWERRKHRGMNGGREGEEEQE